MKKTTLLSNAEIAAFCRQTSMIIHAGITPAEGMIILKNDTIDSEGKAILEQIANSSRRGNLFFRSLEETGMFPNYVIRLIALGEESGNLDDVLTSLADYYEREENISANIKSAVTYPLIMIVMMLLVILVLIVKVLPIFEQVFAQLGTQMSPLSESLLALGTTLSRYSMGITFAFFIIIAAVFITFKSSAGQKMIVRFLSRFPLTKGFYDNIAAGRFASGMYLAFSSGMDTYHSLDMISELVENEEMQRKIEVCKAALNQDANLPESLAKAGIFSNLYSRMVNVGFRSGCVDEVMKQISRNYDEETEKQLGHVISIIEPTLVIILSLIVGMILMSVLLPLMGIMSSIG